MSLTQLLAALGGCAFGTAIPVLFFRFLERRENKKGVK